MTRSRLLGYVVAGIAALLTIFKYGWMAAVHIGPPLNWVLFGCLGLVIAGVSVGSLPLTRETEPRSFALDLPFLGFAAVILLSVLLGMARGFDPNDITKELLSLGLYATYWLVARFVEPGTRFPRLLLMSILFASPVVMAEFLYIYKTYMIPRVMTQQANMTVAGVFVALNYLILIRSKKTWVNVAVALAGAAALFTVVAGMQRTVWIALALILPLNLLLLRLKHYISNKTLWFSYMGSLVGGGITLLVVWLTPLRWLLELLFLRFNTLQKGFGDASLNLRYIDAQNALKLFWASPVMGQGIGCPIWIRWSKEMSNIMDNSYLVFLWKTGVLGTGVFLLFYLSGVFLALRGFFRTTDKTRAFIYLSIAAMLAVPIISGFTCSILYTYRFIFVYAASMGALALLEEPRTKP